LPPEHLNNDGVLIATYFKILHLEELNLIEAGNIKQMEDKTLDSSSILFAENKICGLQLQTRIPFPSKG